VHVVGTAGHVDHGKSSLVRALTGTDPDRWLEERLRGMTLDLGFAHLRFDDGLEAGIVDVPGHERFLHNMLAGAAGMEVLLLVVAANEGPRRQTLEHLEILQYLNVRTTLVAASKIDLLEATERGAALARIADGLRGTAAEGAPLLPLSSVTGEGLEALRTALHAALRALPPRSADAPVYLPVDRSFALAGQGTVVTGTLMQGTVRPGMRLRVAPPGREVRVRGLHVFGEARASAAGGTRVALNLPGIEAGEIERGAVVSGSEFSATDAFEVTFRPLRGALGLLRRRMPVRAYIGSAEVLGKLVFAEVPLEVRPVAAALHLRTAVVAPPGSAFVVRRLSPKDVLGGGVLGGAAAGVTEGPVEASPETEPVVRALRAAGPAGADAATIAASANVRSELAAEALSALAAEGRALRVAKPDGFVDAAIAAQMFARLHAVLRESELAKPWLLGLTSIALARTLDIAENALARLLLAFADDGRLAHRSGYFATPGFAPRLTPEQRAFFDAELLVDPGAPNVPLPFDGLRAKIAAARIEGLPQALDMLLAGGALVKVGDGIYRRSQMTRIRADLENALKAKGSLTMADFRDLIGTSRKYAVPLLEWFDATGVTLRNGDVRILRQTVKV
jgi:selenocysteine-specific elongation factor